MASTQYSILKMNALTVIELTIFQLRMTTFAFKSFEGNILKNFNISFICLNFITRCK